MGSPKGRLSPSRSVSSPPRITAPRGPSVEVEHVRDDDSRWPQLVGLDLSDLATGGFIAKAGLGKRSGADRDVGYFLEQLVQIAELGRRFSRAVR